MSAELAGLVLAAGAGTRMGRPKALVQTQGRPWLELVTESLQLGGCGRTLVVLGAAADEARPLLPASAEHIVAPDWATGLASSLRAGLTELKRDAGLCAVVITLVDLPTMPHTVVTRLLGGAVGPRTLRRAVFADGPGHPVVVGRDHWPALSAELNGDVGAGPFLTRHRADLIGCADLWDGRDVDTIEAARQRGLLPA